MTAALDILDDRSRRILEERWLTEDKMTLHELAAEYGISAERIRQLEVNAIKKLRNAMAGTQWRSDYTRQEQEKAAQ